MAPTQIAKAQCQSTKVVSTSRKAHAFSWRLWISKPVRAPAPTSVERRPTEISPEMRFMRAIITSKFRQFH